MLHVPRPCLSVVVPCYNEQGTIMTLLKHVADSPWVREIIVVDDGSTDNTRNILDRPRLPVRRDHARVVLGRAAPDHALRRQGRADARRRARERLVRIAEQLAERSGLVSRPSVRQRGEPGLPPPDHRPRDPARTSPACGSTTGSPAREPAARSPAPVR